jgi:predicted RND superfamily exporter protein
MRKLTAFVFRFRLPIVIVFGVLTLFFGFWIKDLKVNSDVVSYLPKDDAAVRLFTHLDERFGGNDLVIVAVKADAIFSPRALSDINRLTEAFGRVEGVSSVTSLTNVMDIRRAAGGGMEIDKLVDGENLPSTDAEARVIRDYVMGKERYRGSIISNDATATLIIMQLKSGSDKAAVIRLMQAAAPGSEYPEKLYFGGLPVLTAEIASFIMHDFQLLIPIAALLIILTLYVSFGTIRGILVPLGSVAVSIVWVLGFMSLLKVPLTLVSDIIPAILIAIGTAPCIHILSKYDEDTTRYGRTGEESLAAFTEVGVRVILAAFTIVLGFSSFIIGSYLTAIRDFGIFTSIGVCISLIVSVMLVPAVLTMITVKPRQRKGGRAAVLRRPEDRPMFRGMTAWGDFVVRRRTAILVASLVVLAAGIVGIPFIQRKADFAEFFDPRSQVRQTESLLSKEFGGSRPLQILFTGDLRNPFVQKEMLRFERFLQGEGLARNPVSVADFIIEINDIMDNQRTIPDAPDKIANLMFLLEGQDIVRQLLSDDAGEGQIQAMVGSQEVRELKRTLDAVEGYIKGMATRLVAVDLASLPANDRQSVMDLRIGRSSELIQWLARTRQPDSRVDAALIVEKLSAVSATAGTAREPRKSLAAVLPLFPPALQSDTGFANDVLAEMADLSQGTVAVPEKVFQGLSVAAKGTPQVIEYSVGFTGMPLISWHLDRSILLSQGESLLIALVFIFLLLAVRLRSAVGGILGLVPIILAIVVMFGVMGFVGIPINVATVLVGSIALGIGIDYVIHFSVRFTTYYRGSTTAAEAVKKTIQTTGMAIIINVLAVTMGFIALLFANLLPLRQFGILTAIAMLASGLGAFTLLPALILLAPSAFVGRGKGRREKAQAAR